jgi:hypothetical protein
MNKKIFNSRVQGAWAVVLKKLAPKYCVRKKTVASNRYAELYLPGVDIEYPIAQLMSNDEIRKHKWSAETRKKLLTTGNSALINSISSEEEVEYVFESCNTENTLKALSVYTPTKKFVANLMKKTPSAFITKAVERVPTIFKNLTVEEFIAGNINLWKPAVKLAETDKSGEWAQKLIEHILDGGGSSIADKLPQLISFALKAQKTLDLKEIKEFDYNAYCVAVQIIGKNGDKKLYCKQFFPSIRQLKPMANIFTYIGKIGYHIGDENAEPYVWLKIAYNNMHNEYIYGIFINALHSLKAVVHPDLYNDIIQRMITACPSYSFAQKLMQLEQKLVNKQDLFASIYQLQSVKELCDFFPFTEWKEELAQNAITALISEKYFPVHRFEELSPELQKFAKDEFEAFAQLNAIRSSSTCADAVKIKLQPKAERMLMSAYFNIQYVKEYVENYKMEDASFHALILSGEILKFDGVLEIVQLHAQKWGLTEKQYLWLLQSPCAGISMRVKKFVK